MAALPKPLAQAVSQSDERIALVESISDNFADDLLDVAAAIVDDVSDALASYTTGGVLTSTEISQVVSAIDFAAILADSELDEAVEALMAKYQDVLDLTAKHMIDSGLSPEFYSTDMSLLTALAEMDDARWSLISQELAAVTKESLLRSAFLGATLSDVSEIISSSVGSTMAKANNQARTMLMAYGRQVNMMLGERAGVGWYVYIGPLDQISRPFCRHLAGKVLSVEQIKALENGQIEPPMVHGGGYNCRHHWSPVSDPSLFIDSKDEMANTSDISKAMASKGAGGPKAPKSITEGS